MYIRNMNRAEQLKKIRESTSKKNILWSTHASERMIERQITSTGVIYVILNGELIEEYETNLLIFGWYNKKPLHVVCFYNEESDSVFITSVYHPNQEHFESDFKTRRKQ